jgi:hypothetical protein
MPRSIREVLDQLQDIDEHVEDIAVRTQRGTDMHTLAYTIHSLVACVRDIAESLPAAR